MKSDEESPNGVGNCGGYEEEGGGIRLEQVGVFGYGYKRKHEAPSNGTIANTTPINRRTVLANDLKEASSMCEGVTSS